MLAAGAEDVPVVSWRPPKPRNVPVKAIMRTARVPQDEGEEEEWEEYLPPAQSSQRTALSAPQRGSGLQRLGQGGVSTSPLQYRARNPSPGGRVPRPAGANHQGGSSPLRSRSPSPSLRYPGQVSSRSPSPARHSPSTSPLLSKFSPKADRRHIAVLGRPPRSPSPTSGPRGLQHPQTQTQLKAPSSASSAGPRRLPSPSNTTSAGSKRLPSPSRLPPSPGGGSAGRHQAGASQTKTPSRLKPQSGSPSLASPKAGLQRPAGKALNSAHKSPQLETTPSSRSARRMTPPSSSSSSSSLSAGAGPGRRGPASPRSAGAVSSRLATPTVYCRPARPKRV